MCVLDLEFGKRTPLRGGSSLWNSLPVFPLEGGRYLVAHGNPRQALRPIQGSHGLSRLAIGPPAPTSAPAARTRSTARAAARAPRKRSRPAGSTQFLRVLSPIPAASGEEIGTNPDTCLAIPDCSRGQDIAAASTRSGRLPIPLRGNWFASPHCQPSDAGKRRARRNLSRLLPSATEIPCLPSPSSSATTPAAQLGVARPRPPPGDGRA